MAFQDRLRGARKLTRAMAGTVIRNFERTAPEQIAPLAEYGVATVHEAIGRIGLMASHVRPIYPGASIAANAVTVTVAPGDNLMIHVAVELCRDGDVLVVVPTSPCEDGYFGDLLGGALKGRGVRGLIIDTSFFTGNFPEKASVEACSLSGNPSTEGIVSGAVHWESSLDQTELKGNASNAFEVKGQRRRATHLRLNIFPDGGVARLRVHGDVVPDPAMFTREVDLAAIESGGFVLSCSDMHYGNRNNLILPGASTHMGDGWETKRRRGAGHDWAIVRLARRGVVERVEMDTDHFKGNAPGKCDLEWCDAIGDGTFDAGKAKWRVLVPESPVNAHAQHEWRVSSPKPATHVRLNIYPDGGVARLRLVGKAV